MPSPTSRTTAARANVAVTRAQLADAYQALAEITGVPVTDLQGLPADFQPELPIGGADQWVATALDSNPNLRAASLQVESARHDIATARAQRWPTVYLTGNYGDSQSDGSSTDNIDDVTSDFENESRSRSLNLVVDVPIFRGGAIQSEWMTVVGVAGKSPARLDRIADAAQQRDSVPAALPVPDAGIAERLHVAGGECLVGALQLLESHDVGLKLLQPAQQHVQPRVDPVDVVARDPEPAFLCHQP